MNKLNVLHLNTERTWRGGEQQTLYLAKGLSDRGHRSAIIAQPSSPLVERAKQVGVETYEVKTRGEIDLFGIHRLVKIMRSFEPDIVHMHTSHAHSLGVLSSKIAGKGRRIVSRRVDFSIHRHKFSLSGIKYRYGVDRYIAISKAIRDVLIQDGIDPSRIELVSSGIDPDRFKGENGLSLREEWGFSQSTPLVGTVAHFGWHKALEYLIRAASLIHKEKPDVRFVIVGDGDLRPQLEAERRELGLEEVVKFAGFRSDIGACLAAMDVFVMPSVMEGLCTSILDALAVGKPVVASQVGGIPEIIEHDVTGLLVPPRDPEALKDAIHSILDDPLRVARLRQAGRDKVEKKFSHQAMIDGSLSVYERVLSGSPGNESDSSA